MRVYEEQRRQQAAQGTSGNWRLNIFVANLAQIAAASNFNPFAAPPAAAPAVPQAPDLMNFFDASAGQQQQQQSSLAGNAAAATFNPFANFAPNSMQPMAAQPPSYMSQRAFSNFFFLLVAKIKILAGAPPPQPSSNPFGNFAPPPSQQQLPPSTVGPAPMTSGFPFAPTQTSAAASFNPFSAAAAPMPIGGVGGIYAQTPFCKSANRRRETLTAHL